MDVDFMLLNSCFVLGYATFLRSPLSFPMLQVKRLQAIKIIS